MFSALTFNMQNGEPWSAGPPLPIDLEATIGFLRACDADILFLQEVERGFDGGVQALPPPHFNALRAALPSYDAVFAYPSANPDELPFGLGLAIFSKFPLGDFWREDLPVPEIFFEFGGRQRRPSSRLLIGTQTVIGGHPLTLLNTHLQAFFMIGANANDHPQQRHHILTQMASAPPPVLIGGDFNCTPEDHLVDEFARAGFPSVLDGEVTWKRRPYCVDQLFHGSGLVCQSREVIPTSTSDHHAVCARFSFSQ